ncbi:MAG TPA: tRNA (guanosine(46)-N7)-methyltransferase TrmB, partial [Micavibrio sp.]|nr:tRNA (guanosine(46)-N7)-methyltransferase TrmB [Micavibrio sp.]
PGGAFVMATDVDALAEWMVTETMNHGGFEWEAKSAKDWQTMPDDWFVTTRYAAKGVDAGRRETYLLFKKK